MLCNCKTPFIIIWHSAMFIFSPVVSPYSPLTCNRISASLSISPRSSIVKKCTKYRLQRFFSEAVFPFRHMQLYNRQNSSGLLLFRHPLDVISILYILYGKRRFLLHEINCIFYSNSVQLPVCIGSYPVLSASRLSLYFIKNKSTIRPAAFRWRTVSA